MSVAIHDFGKLTTGQPVQLITLKNDKIEVQLLTYAAIIHRIIVPDRKGNPTDVVLVLATVIVVGFASVWYPVKFLSRKFLVA